LRGGALRRTSFRGDSGATWFTCSKQKGLATKVSSGHFRPRRHSTNDTHPLKVLPPEASTPALERQERKSPVEIYARRYGCARSYTTPSFRFLQLLKLWKFKPWRKLPFMLTLTMQSFNFLDGILWSFFSDEIPIDQIIGNSHFLFIRLPRP